MYDHAIQVELLAARLDSGHPTWYLEVDTSDTKYMHSFLALPPNAPAFEQLCAEWQRQITRRKDPRWKQ